MYRSGWRQYISKFNDNDEELTIQSVPNEKTEEWIQAEVPYFECSDPVIEETYYFRWWVFRKHIKETEAGRIITEFLPPVPWAGPYNSINCACGHHIAEARWMKRDRNLAREYLSFWLDGKGQERSYSSWLADVVYQYAVATGDKEFAVEALPALVRYYEAVETSNMTAYGLFWSYDDRDAMELSISGSGLRPTLNSYMYGNAEAIASIAGWAGEMELKERYSQKAEDLKEKILKFLWDEKAHFFRVIPMEKKDSSTVELEFDRIPSERKALEEIGYIPWYFSIPEEFHDKAWNYLKREDCFKAPWGITTAERRHPLFMNTRSVHECQWNGPVWPFATTQTLNSLIRLLQERESDAVNRMDFLEQIKIYAGSHYRTDENGKRLNWLDENQHPDTGIWIAREILKGWGWPEEKGGYERGKDYNHSAFCDLVIRGICGICPKEDSLILDPLLPENVWKYFLLEDLPCKGHSITVGYDWDGSRYGKGKGLWIEIDGRIAAMNPFLSRIEVKL